jgi:predicted RNA binding protein YcfA (HicA-like mRNA interferase family)
MRVHGSHHVYSKPGEKANLSIPVHGNPALRVGTLHALLKNAGLTESGI